MTAKSKTEYDEKTKETISEKTLKDILSEQLERVGSGGLFVWSLFFLCVTPNILNGFHVASYTLLGHLPDDQWCAVADLQSTNWTVEQQRNISQKNLNTGGCTIWNYDYAKLSTLSYEDALNYTSNNAALALPAEIRCTSHGVYAYSDAETTFVAEWDLVCDRAIQRTSAQVALSLGKFFGSFSFGVLADKFGRKASFTLGAAFFIVASLLCTFSPWYELFLAGRFGLGAASSGLFYPAFTMIVENICLRHRSWMSIAFSASYPIGMILLAVAAYLVPQWRYLQLTLTVPALLLILNCCLMNESPRWLITKKRYDQAYRILFKQKCHYEVKKESIEAITDKEAEALPEPELSLWTKLKEGPLKQFNELFGTWKVRRLIFTSYFMFCVTSLSYYVTALNAANLSVSRYLYVAITGMVDLPSYLVPVIMLRYTGRRPTTVSLFILTGVALLMVLAVPADQTAWIISFAMLGRFGISATYSIVTLYTAELYPTEIRNSALGTCSTWAHVGSISAPYVVDVLGMIGWYIPTTICGCCVIVAGLLTLTLPETSTHKLPDRIEEVPSESETDSDAEDSTTSNIAKVKEIESNKNI
ncbi:organic cation transporter protein isoform X1 [Rhagoletis pomonella]|uniref:organic cation transporter protein isoform X1 n=2 Tax=Rhagoletis TaxID=28609 RepID=UPI00177E6415|nr:organic cation transporter protein isoform X1 [Rhagoletis pomonella]